MSKHKLKNLGNLPRGQIQQALADIPITTTFLDLCNNDLGRKSGAELAQALAALPPNVTSVDLSYNFLGDKTGDELGQVLEALPETVTSLILKRNGLGEKTGVELAQAFRAIPAGVTSLDLSDNFLGDNTGVELAQYFRAIPVTVTSLDLSINSLYVHSATVLAEAFKALPESVTSLHLRGNGLQNKTGPELAEILAALPSNMTSLDLGYNGLHNKTGAELVEAFAALPVNVNSLNLNWFGDDLEFAYQQSDILWTINMREFRADLLIDKVNEIIVPRQNLLGFDFLIPSREIDEVRLPQYINELEKKNTSVALLTCGLLLSGRIETTIVEPYAPNELNQYLEKRAHDAISFYTKAAQDPNLKPLIDFILWELKTTTDMLSVQQRLALYEVAPSNDVIETYQRFNHPSDSIPLSNNHWFFPQANNNNVKINPEGTSSTLLLGWK